MIFKWGLKVRGEPENDEKNETLNRAMEYAGVVGVKLVDMLASINSNVEVIIPCMPIQHTFGRDGLQNFIHNHQDHLEWLEDQLGNLMAMMENTVGRLSVVNKSYWWDLYWVE